MQNLKDQYQNEVDYRAGMISSIMEPMIYRIYWLVCGNHTDLDVPADFPDEYYV